MSDEPPVIVVPTSNAVPINAFFLITAPPCVLNATVKSLSLSASAVLSIWKEPPILAVSVIIALSTNSCLHLKFVAPMSKLLSAFGLSPLIISATNSTPSASLSPTLTLPFKLV